MIISLIITIFALFEKKFLSRYIIQFSLALYFQQMKNNSLYRLKHAKLCKFLVRIFR